MNQQELKELKEAKQLLENPGLAIQITNLLGDQIEKGFKQLPDKWNEKIGEITQKSLLKASDVAIFTMQKNTTKKSSNTFHKLAVAATGAAGGFFGLPALAIELPTSTTIMLRSIIDIARENGENINNKDTKLACLEVFALGGKSDDDDGVETSYYSIRAALATSAAKASKFILDKGLAEEGAPAMVKLITKIAERFSVQVTEKSAGQAIPIIGSVFGAAINTLFINHFQNMAKGHFIVRRLERKYGKELVQNEYEKMN